MRTFLISLTSSHNANVWRFIIISFINFYDYEGSPEGSALPARIFIVVIKLLQSLRLCLSELLHWNDNGGGTGLQGRRLPLLALKTNVSLSETRWEEPVFEEVIRNPPPPQLAALLLGNALMDLRRWKVWIQSQADLNRREWSPDEFPAVLTVSASEALQAPVGSDEICFLAELFNLNLTPGENSCRAGQGSINQLLPICHTRPFSLLAHLK